MSPGDPISISEVRLGTEVEQMLIDVVRSGVIAQGPRVAELEQRFAAMIGVHHVVAVNNGTTALIAALVANGLGPGDEVITSPFTFVATLNAILATGATARFADISIEDFNVSAATISPLLTPSTAALLPVHLYGQCADMQPIADVATDRELVVIEDAAQAHAATVDGRSAGTWGTGCFSLYATKNLTSGEGGLISTNDAAVADRLRVLRNQGMRQRYQYEMAGNNYRLTDLHAAVCLPQLDTYADQLERRRANAAALTSGLAGIDGLTPPRQLPGRTHVWHQFTVLVDDSARLNRDQLAETLVAEGIGCGVYYPRLVHDYDCYRDNPNVVVDDTPVAAQVARQCLSLPVHPHLTPGQIDRIVTTVRRSLGA